MRGRGAYLAAKIGWALLTLALVITFNFVLFRILPGDPARSIAHDPRISPATVAALSARFGLDKPLFFNFASGNWLDSQFFAYVGRLAAGDLGVSYAFRDRPVVDMLGLGMVNTLWLILPANVLAIIVGTLMGLVAAWRRGTTIDAGALAIGLILWAMPTFFMGIILLFLGAAWFDLPTAGKQTIGAEYTSWWESTGDLLRHLLMPTLTFTLVLLGEYLLIMRSSVIEVFSEDYILTAKAKGLSTYRIIRDHALRNAMLPMVTLIAINLGFIVSGAIQIEEVFSWPGLGQLTVNAVRERDYPVLQGAFLLLAFAVVLANLAAELLYGWLDPRVREA